MWQEAYTAVLDILLSALSRELKIQVFIVCLLQHLTISAADIRTEPNAAGIRHPWDCTSLILT